MNENSKKQEKSFDLDKVLREIGSGWKAVIKRIEPTWCDGHIHTIELDPDEPISMEFIREEYGGRKIQVIIQKPNGDFVTSRTLKFPDPPRREGRDLVRFPDEPKPNAQPQTSPLGEMKDIFKIMLDSQEKQMKGLTDSIDRRIDALERVQGTAPGAPDAPAPIDQLKQSIGAIKQINNLKEELGLSSDQPQQQAEQENTITRAVDKFTDLMIEKEQAKIKAQIENAGGAQKAPPLPAASTYTPPAQEQQQQPTEAISNLSDLEFAAHVRNRLDALDPEERDQVLDGFIELYHPQEDDQDPEQDFSSEEDENDIPSLGSVKVIEDDDGGRVSESEPQPA